MKALKTLLILLSAVLLTGCYTQLQYSQRMSRVTDEPERRYVQSDERQVQNGQTSDEVYYSDEEYVPVYYKNYDYVDSWAACGCNPYRDYQFYDYGMSYNSWHNYYRPYYRSYYHNWSPFWSWRHHSHFHNTFTFSIHFGSSYYHSFFYDPFYYSPFYHGFGYGYNPIAYNYYYFYNNTRYGYYDGGNNYREFEDRRYGPRNIGASRVSDSPSRVRTRNRDAVIDRTNTINRESSVRTRTRGTVNRAVPSTVRERSSRTRTRDSYQPVPKQREQAIERDDRRRDRSSYIIRYRRVDSNESIRRMDSPDEIRTRLRSKMAPQRDYDVRERVKRSRPTFFQRLKGFFDSNSSRISNQSRILRSRSSFDHKPSINRSPDRSRHSVTRSRSSSNDSRPNRSSSRSRSSSDSNSPGRSRGN